MNGERGAGSAAADQPLQTFQLSSDGTPSRSSGGVTGLRERFGGCQCCAGVAFGRAWQSGKPLGKKSKNTCDLVPRVHCLADQPSTASAMLLWHAANSHRKQRQSIRPCCWSFAASTQHFRLSSESDAHTQRCIQKVRMVKMAKCKTAFRAQAANHGPAISTAVTARRRNAAT